MSSSAPVEKTCPACGRKLDAPECHGVLHVEFCGRERCFRKLNQHRSTGEHSKSGARASRGALGYIKGLPDLKRRVMQVKAAMYQAYQEADLDRLEGLWGEWQAMLPECTVVGPRCRAWFLKETADLPEELAVSAQVRVLVDADVDRLLKDTLPRMMRDFARVSAA